MEKQKFKGSCHCGKVAFEAQIDMSKGTIRCNCTYCLKERYWGVHVGFQDFKLLSGHESLRSYSKSRRDVAFEPTRKLEVYENDLAFCITCGVHSFNIGNIPEIGGEYVSINVACFDDVDFKEVMKYPIQFMNGKDDDWFKVPSYTAHL